eukprot:SAG31_NODE_314_length_17854_cov_3.932075_13_plen_150_part_00
MRSKSCFLSLFRSSSASFKRIGILHCFRPRWPPRQAWWLQNDNSDRFRHSTFATTAWGSRRLRSIAPSAQLPTKVKARATEPTVALPMVHKTSAHPKALQASAAFCNQSRRRCPLAFRRKPRCLPPPLRKLQSACGGSAAAATLIVALR